LELLLNISPVHISKSMLYDSEWGNTNRGTLVMATGAGKTILSAAITAQIKVPTISTLTHLTFWNKQPVFMKIHWGSKLGK